MHIGGTLAEISAAESSVAAGKLPDRPFILVGQQDAVDPSRRAGTARVLWSYAHVAHGYPHSVRTLIESQIERFAPGFRDRVVEAIETRPADFERWNENLVGGDVMGGSNRGLRLVFRPTLTLRPHQTPDKRVFLCSASTPPGGGVHGMSGYCAARAALRSVGPFGLTALNTMES